MQKLLFWSSPANNKNSLPWETNGKYNQLVCFLYTQTACFASIKASSVLKACSQQYQAYAMNKQFRLSIITYKFLSTLASVQSIPSNQQKNRVVIHTCKQVHLFKCQSELARVVTVCAVQFQITLRVTVALYWLQLLDKIQSPPLTTNASVD